MTEDFLHYVWKYRLFSANKLKTTDENHVVVINTGIHNKNSGPDFLNAQVRINHQLWVGNVEIHKQSSDWYLHKHEVDENYDAVILHVVWEYDAPIFRKDNTLIPTLVLKDLIPKNLLKNYKNLLSNQPRWIPCESEIGTTNSFVFSNWKERLFFERLENKSNLIQRLLEKSKTNYEAVLFQLLAKNFGLKVNGEAFLQLAMSVDFSILRKESFDVLKLSSLLFGQAGFLDDAIEDGYYDSLKNEYSYLKHKYKLQSISKNQFSFFRMRPHNFPTIRIAQLTALYHTHQNLFSSLIKIKTLNGFYDFFKVEIHEFWKTHYTFTTESKKSSKKLSKSFVDLLIINTIIPIQFMYFKEKGMLEEMHFLNILKQIKSEKNAIIRKFSELKIVSKNAFDSQALLELKNSYCTHKNCLECAVGNRLLKK